jgi:hypothetical protein
MLRLVEQMTKDSKISSHFEFTFRKGGHKGESYEANILAPSIRMTELYTNLKFEISSLEKPYFIYIIGIDTEKRISVVMDESSLIERNFTKAFLAELGIEDWNFFTLYNRVLRNSSSEDFTDFASLEVDFTDYVQSIEKEEEFVRYSDIFPNARNPSLVYKGEGYFVSDEYYITHKAPILYCGLTCCVREKDGSLDWENPKTRFAILDYEKQTYSPYSEGEYFDQAFFAEVKKKLPDLATFIKKRHANLLLVYENYCKRTHLHFPSPKATVATLSSHGDIGPLASLISPKVGRNDPCPCGSGKKYKKCCMN